MKRLLVLPASLVLMTACDLLGKGDTDVSNDTDNPLGCSGRTCYTCQVDWLDDEYMLLDRSYGCLDEVFVQIEGLPTPNPILDFVEGVQAGLDVWRAEINADVVFDVEEEGVGGFINEVGHDIATPDPDLGYWDPQLNGEYEVFAQTFSIDDSEFHSCNIIVFSALVSPTDSQLIEWTNVITDPSEMHLPTVIAHEFGHCLGLDHPDPFSDHEETSIMRADLPFGEVLELSDADVDAFRFIYDDQWPGVTNWVP